MSNEERLDKILDIITEGGSFISQKEFLILIAEPMFSVHEDYGQIVKYSSPENPIKLREEKAKAELTKLIEEETTKARIDEVERFLVEPSEVIPYNNNTFADGFRYVVDKLQTRLTELKERENSNE